MITAVDTNVLIDIFGASQMFGEASSKALRICLNQGAVVASAVAWSESRAAFASDAEFERAMHVLGIGYSTTSQQSANLAGAAWKMYRATGGTRVRVVADFIIGAHATLQCERLLTRDRGFYRKYFGKLAVVNSSD